MPRFIVLRGCRPQARRVADRPGLRSGVLVDGDPVTVFANRRQANRAIERTQLAARRFADPVFGGDALRNDRRWLSLFSPEPFTVVPVEMLASSGVSVDESEPDTVSEAQPATPQKRPATLFDSPLFRDPDKESAS